MSSRKSTDELIADLVRKPEPRRLWPSFPLVPLTVCLIFGVLVDAAAGFHQWEWSALTTGSLTMALVALVTALFGLVLCLEFVSPIGNLDLLVGAVATLFAALAVGGLSQEPALGMGQILACYWFIVVMASPGLLTALWLLRQGASLHPALVGAGAGMLSSGVASFLFLLHCPVVPDGSGIHSEIAAIATVGSIGAVLGRRLLKW